MRARRQRKPIGALFEQSRNMETSEIRLLHAFTVLMAERSVSRAGERLGLTQPAASRTLAKLRNAFGDPLLIRSRSGMVPTERAVELLAIAREVLASYERLTKPSEGFDYAHSPHGFVISAPEFAERLLVPPLFRRLHVEAPNVRMTIRAPDPERAYAMLESGELDLRIAWLTAPVKSLRSMPLFQDRLVCIADARHGPALTLEQFLTQPSIRTSSYAASTTGKVIDQAFERLGREPVRIYLVQNFQVIPYAIPGTNLIATLPSLLAREYVKHHALRVYEPPLRFPPIRYGAYWHERRHKDAAHKWLRAMIAAAARSLAG
jgi:DNA-binding transcriptional LysR family regulator